jgi:acyl-CoA synthetase (AMP-forming)/AMP-acid ligase II
MSLVFNALDQPAAARARVHCLSDGSAPLTLAELGSNARQAGAWLEGVAGRSGTVAALLTASHDCLATLFGAFRSGITLVSLPHPARGMDAEEYLAQIGTMCALTGATHVLCDPGLTGLLGAGPVPVHPFSGWSAGRPPRGTEAPGSFVQFTSGSTGTPRGIVLSLDALDANLTSMYDWLEPREGAVVCSWLPLSHDMGLIGLALYAICSVNPPWSIPSELVLMTPESFLADPGTWMRACTEYRATSTTSPPFALRLAARSLRSPGTFDLSSLRSFVVGSEPVPADGLREFEAVAREYGLSPHALCPGYGMAEAALAVAIGPPTSPWSSVHLDPDALAAREWMEVAEAGVELVSCGPPVLHTEVRSAGNSPLGELEIRSPSLLDAYVGDASSPLTEDGWLHTADLGHVHSEGVFVAGRTDDVLIVAGRNIDARELDALVTSHPTCRPGNAACVPDGSGRYVVVAEPRTEEMDLAELRAGAREIRVSLTQRFGASPSKVVFIVRGTLPKTPSGKVRRSHLRTLWAGGRLQEVASV